MWKKIRRNYRRLIASLLTLAMVVTNAGGNLGTIFAAGETENALFLVEGEELREAIREAEEQGEVFDFSELHLAAKRKSIKTRYEKLLGKKEGAVYALNLEIDDNYAPEGTELLVFYNAGTEDVIFLFLNGSDLVVDYRVNIDGYETEPVRVNPNTVNIEADGEKAPAYAENYEAADMIDDEAKKLGAEVLNPEETSGAAEEETGTGEEESRGDASAEETGDAVTEESSQAEDGSQEGEKGDASAKTEESEASEEGKAEESDRAEEGKPAEEEDEAEAEEESVEETEAETESEDETEPETEAEAHEEEKSDAGDGELLSISRHEAVIVAVSAEELEDREAGAEAEEEAEAETEEETEAETEKETEAETEAETETETEEESEAESAPENKPDEDESEAADAENKAEGNETEVGTGNVPEESGAETESKPEESESGTETGEDIIIEETGKEDSVQIPEEEGSSTTGGADSEDSMKNDQIEMDGQMLEDDSVEILGELKGKEYDTVTVLDHVNARAWKIALEDIEAIISSEAMDYVVEYQVNDPEGAAVKGADSVAEGENLYFAVEPEEGYEIVGVYANGSEVEEVEDTSDLASASDWKGYANVYVVEGVEEDLWVEVEVEEREPIIAAAVYTAETEDAVFSIDVPEGAFEEKVELKVAKIEEENQLKELTDQANEALKENHSIVGAMVYDIAFVSLESGEEVEPLKTVAVSMSLKEAIASQEDIKEAKELSVVHLPDSAQAETIATMENAEATEISFQADSFSLYMFALVMPSKVSVDGQTYPSVKIATNVAEDGATITLLEDITESLELTDRSFTFDLNGHTWTGKGGSTLVANISKKDVSITITGGGTIVAEAGYRAVEIPKKSSAGGQGTLRMTGIKLQGSGSELTKTIAVASGTSKKSGGIVAAIDTDVVADGCEFWNGYCGENGGAVVVAPYYTGSQIEVSFVNCAFHENKAKTKGGAISAEVNGKYTGRKLLLKVDNCTFEGNTASSGGAINLENNNTGSKASVKAEITNETKFAQNEASSNGGAIYTENRGYYEDNDLIITNSYFIDNMAGSYGSGGAICAKTSLNLSNVELQDNKAGSRGGAIYVSNKESGTFNATIGGTKFINNESSSGSGGALALEVTSAAGTIALQKGTVFEGNKSAAKDFTYDGGGAIYAMVKNGATVSLSDVTMHDNIALGDGGAISADIKNLSVTDTKIYNNEGGKAGGGIYLKASTQNAQAEFARLEARGNKAQSSGGAVNLSGTVATGKAIFDSCTITDNTAGQNGGGIYSLLPEITIKDSAISGNTANKFYGGGAYLAYYTGGGVFTVSGSTAFYGNKAPNDPKTSTFKVSGNTPSADIFVRNSNGTGSAKSEATLNGFDELLANEVVLGNITYKLVHTDPAKQQYGYSKNVSSAYSVGYYCTKSVGDCVYLSATDAQHSGSGNIIVTTTLQEAVKSAKANKFQEIYVCGTIDITEEDEEDLNKSGITFKRCSECNNYALFNIGSGEEVTFDGVKIDGDKILSSEPLVKVSGTLTIKGETDIRNGNNSSSKGGGAIYADAGSKLNIAGGTIENNVAVRGGAIATGFLTPVVSISGGSIKENRTSGDGGAIYSDSAIVKVNGDAVIENNIAGKSGGAICGYGLQNEYGRHSKIYIEGGTFRGNSCAGNGGGAIYMYFFSELYIGVDGGRPLFENNSTSELGGAVALYQYATGKIYSGDFIGNRTVSAISNFAGGGAVYINAGCSMEMKNLYVAGNTQKKSTTGGGGLYTCSTGRTAIFKSEGAYIAENTGAGGGPADIYFWGGGGALAYVSDYVLGGAVANWTRPNGTEAPDLWGTNQSFTIVSHVDPGGKATAEAIARKEGVVMEGNHSDSWGAAIANNGSLTIGTEELSLTVNKVWNGDETKVPDEILVYLMKALNGGEWEKVTLGERPDDAYKILNSGNKWSYTWENLGDSKAVDWSVSEAAINGYTGTITGPELDTKWNKVGKHYIITLTNTENPDAKTAGLQVEKQLFSSEADPNAEFTFTVSLDAEGPFAYRIWESNHKTEDLKPIYDDASEIKISLKPGQIFTIEGIPVGTRYTVTEESGDYLAYIDGVLNEDAKVEGSIKSEDNSIVYMNIEKTQVNVTKVWNDAENQDGIRPESIQVELVKVIGQGDEKKEEPTGRILELNENNNWMGSFTDLPKYEVDSSPVVWGVKEVNAGDGYTSIITEDEKVGFIVTNTHTPETVEVKGQKTWKDADNQDGIRPTSITIHLYSNGEEISSKVVTAEDDWKWSFGNLPKYYNKGMLVSYTFSEEISTEGYVAEITQPNEENGYTGEIINSYKPDTTYRTVIKRWEDNNNQDGVRPNQVTVQLKADGVNYQDPVVLTAPDWSYTWENLDKYKNQGTLINYEVVEIESDDLREVYTPEVGYNEADYVFTVTNTHTPATVKRAVNKVWNDENNKDNVRPASIIVQLLENDEVRDTVILSEATGWSHTWDALSRYRDGQEIRYQVIEVKVENYNDPEYSYDESTNTFIITNTHTSNTPDRPNRPGGGGGGNPGGPSGGDNPGGPGTTTIEEPGVPLANLPPESMTELIEDAEVPLAALPRTGDSRHTRALMMMFGIAGLGMLLTAAGFRKRKDESDD